MKWAREHEGWIGWDSRGNEYRVRRVPTGVQWLCEISTGRGCCAYKLIGRKPKLPQAKKACERHAQRWLDEHTR